MPLILLRNMKRSSEACAIKGHRACEMSKLVHVETTFFILIIKPIQRIGKY